MSKELAEVWRLLLLHGLLLQGLLVLLLQHLLLLLLHLLQMLLLL